MICCVQSVNYAHLFKFIYFMPGAIYCSETEDDYKTSVKICRFNFRKIVRISDFSKDVNFSFYVNNFVSNLDQFIL